MSGAQQSTFMNQRSFGDPLPTVIGQPFGGGFWAGLISTTANGVATHYLVVGPKSTAQFTGTWKTSNTNTVGTTSVINGPANTTAMITAGAAAHPCGQFCDNLTVAGFSDWYMPAQNELEVCYFNLKPTTEINSTLYGANPNAVPARASNYTTGTPAQTSATIFRIGGAEAFPDARNWSSTEISTNNARFIQFGYGAQLAVYKTTSYATRAVRRVAV